MSEQDRLRALAYAVGQLLDGPTDDSTGAMDAVTSAYDDWASLNAHTQAS